MASLSWRRLFAEYAFLLDMSRISKKRFEILTGVLDLLHIDCSLPSIVLITFSYDSVTLTCMDIVCAHMRAPMMLHKTLVMKIRDSFKNHARAVTNITE